LFSSNYFELSHFEAFTAVFAELF